MLLLWVVGKPVGEAIPRLVDLFAQTGNWKPLAAALLSLGFCAAPVPTVELVRSMVARLPGKTKE